MTTIQFDDTLVLFGDHEGADTGWFFTDLIDWYTVSDSKSDVRERPAAHGAFGIADDWRSSLTVSVSGVYRGSSHEDAVAAATVLGMVLKKNKPTRLTVDDGDVVTSRVVSVRHAPVEDTHGGSIVKFSADMVASDPYRYGPDIEQIADVPVSGGGLHLPFGTRRSDDAVDVSTSYWDFGPDGSSGRLSVTNFGTAETFPLLSVTGGLGSGFIITDVTKGQSVRFDRVIPDGSSVTVNQRTGRATIDGQSDVSGFITVRQFFSIGPAETHIIQFSPLGTVTGMPQLTVRTAPAY